MPDLPGQAEIDDHPDPGNGDEAVDLNERLEERLDEPARIEREAAVQAGDRIMQLFAGREDDPPSSTGSFHAKACSFRTSS